MPCLQVSTVVEDILRICYIYCICVCLCAFSEPYADSIVTKFTVCVV